MALPAPDRMFPTLLQQRVQRYDKDPPNTLSSSSRPNAGSSDRCTAKVTAIPIKIPAGMIQR